MVFCALWLLPLHLEEEWRRREKSEEEEEEGEGEKGGMLLEAEEPQGTAQQLTECETGG